jgi:hypothetical protein
MNRIIFEIKDQLYETAVLVIEFFKGINPWAAGGVLLALTLVVFRKWMLGKILSFGMTMFLLLVLYVRINHFLITGLSQEASSLNVGVFHTIAVIIAGAIFLYYAAIKE